LESGVVIDGQGITACLQAVTIAPANQWCANTPVATT